MFLPFSPGLILSAPCAFAVGFLDCTQIVIAVVCLCGWLGFAGFCRSGNAILQIEMAPRLGTLNLNRLWKMTNLSVMLYRGVYHLFMCDYTSQYESVPNPF